MNEQELTNGFKIEFKKDYYQDTIVKENGEVEVLPELKTMYHFSLEKDYFMHNKQDILGQAIKDMEEVLEAMKKTYEKNQKALQSWDEISK